MKNVKLIYLLFAFVNPAFGQFYIGTDVYIGASGIVSVYETSLITGTAGNLNINGVVHDKSTNSFFAPGTVVNGTGSIEFNGTSTQFFDGNGVTVGCDVKINNANNLELTTLSIGPSPSANNDLVLSKVLNLTSGDIITTTNKVSFLSTGAYINESNASHVNGWVSRTGNTSWTFPVGDGTLLRTASISAPPSVTDKFDCKYIHSDPNPTYPDNLLDPTLYTVSSCEYWMLNRTAGAANVVVTLTWDAGTSCAITDIADLRVAKWDGALWKDLGNGFNYGTLAAGGLETNTAVTSFSPFTLASISIDNPLPILLMNFNANYAPITDQVNLDWETYSEINNDFFTIERSTAGLNWEEIAWVDGAGTTNGVLHYEDIDRDPLPGTSYYRLKQTDFDGAFTYSDIKSVTINSLTTSSISVYPNPFSTTLTISARGEMIQGIVVYNGIGQVVYQRELSELTTQTSIDLENLVKGIYALKVNTSSGSELQKIIKN